VLKVTCHNASQLLKTSHRTDVPRVHILTPGFLAPGERHRERHTKNLSSVIEVSKTQVITYVTWPTGASQLEKSDHCTDSPHVHM
jgi:hypothetical protein